MSFSDAFKRPFQDFKTLIIGIVIMLIPIVNFIGIGYLLKCASSGIRRDYRMPKWEGWLDLFVKGIVATVISIIYMIPAIVIILLVGMSAWSNLSGMMGTGLNMAAVMSLLGTAAPGLLVGLIVCLIGLFIGSAAIVRYVEKGTFAAAFELGAIVKKAFTGTFFAAWFVGGIYWIILTAILGMIPWIGSAIATFIGGVTWITLIAEAYGKA